MHELLADAAARAARYLDDIQDAARRSVAERGRAA